MSTERRNSGKYAGVAVDELQDRLARLKEEMMSGEVQTVCHLGSDKDLNELQQKWKNAVELNKKAQEHIKKLSWENAVLERDKNDNARRLTRLEKEVKHLEEKNKMLEMELKQHQTIDRGLDTLRQRFSQQADVLNETKLELRRANDRAKQVENAAIKASRDANANCMLCDAKVAKIKELTEELRKKHELITRIKMKHEKHVSELNANNQSHTCDCRYELMEAKADIKNHVAASEKLREEREQYKVMYEQYAKERQSVMDRLQNSEDKIAERDDRIRKLRRESQQRISSGDCRVVGAMKETVADLTDEVRAKDRDIEQLRDLVAKLDAQLEETEQIAEAGKDENQELANELIKRLREYETCVVEREKLIQENAKLKSDMVALVPKLDNQTPKRSSVVAESERLAAKLQQTEIQLRDAREELRKLRHRNCNRWKEKNATESDDNPHGGGSSVGHRNCVTCRIMDKLQMGLVDCGHKNGQCRWDKKQDGRKSVGRISLKPENDEALKLEQRGSTELRGKSVDKSGNDRSSKQESSVDEKPRVSRVNPELRESRSSLRTSTKSKSYDTANLTSDIDSTRKDKISEESDD